MNWDERPPHWTKRNIIEAVRAAYVPYKSEDLPQNWEETLEDPQAREAMLAWCTRQFASQGHMIALHAFARVALGRPEGRATPYLEHELWRRIRRVLKALQENRDLNAAYEIPLDDEVSLTADAQLEDVVSEESRFMAKLIDDMDREIREGRRKAREGRSK